MLEIKVTDTGKGISSEYLRTSLFNRMYTFMQTSPSNADSLTLAFCQEDPLASGTGLGLSICRSIVTMLRGTIDVQSEVGVGTEVIVRLPLSRLPGTATPVSTPSSSATEGAADDSIDTLKADYGDTSVALLGFDDHGQRSVLTGCIRDWLGLKIISSTSHESTADICVVDEKELANLSQHSQNTLAFVVLCNDATRTQKAFRHNMHTITVYVLKPVGPHKLAKALRSCLDRAKSTRTGLAPMVAVSDEDSPMESEAETVKPDLGIDRLSIESGPLTKQFEADTNGAVAASDSVNAQMAVSSPYTSGAITITEDNAFPFPSQDDDEDDQEEADGVRPLWDQNIAEKARVQIDSVQRDLKRPPILSRVTAPVADTRFPHTPVIPTTPSKANVSPMKLRNQGFSPMEASRDSDVRKTAIASKFALNGGEPIDSVQPERQPPRMLLVDDNKINLRLLETFMRKRKYQFIDSAENGQFAVQAAEAHEFGYDIIFMGRLLNLFWRPVLICSRYLYASDEWVRGNKSNSRYGKCAQG